MIKPRRQSLADKFNFSSDEENENENESAGGLLAAEQEAERRRHERRKIRGAARQFINSMAAVEGESESDEVESDNESNASENSFIVGDDFCD